jgi:hypothetical protein
MTGLGMEQFVAMFLVAPKNGGLARVPFRAGGEGYGEIHMLMIKENRGGVKPNSRFNPRASSPLPAQ